MEGVGPVRVRWGVLVRGRHGHYLGYQQCLSRTSNGVFDIIMFDDVKYKVSWTENALHRAIATTCVAAIVDWKR